jgi:hypothetical protein
MLTFAHRSADCLFYGRDSLGDRTTDYLFYGRDSLADRTTDYFLFIEVTLRLIPDSLSAYLKSLSADMMR